MGLIAVFPLVSPGDLLLEPIPEGEEWRSQRGSNPQPLPWQGRGLNREIEPTISKMTSIFSVPKKPKHRRDEFPVTGDFFSDSDRRPHLERRRKGLRRSEVGEGVEESESTRSGDSEGMIWLIRSATIIGSCVHFRPVALMTSARSCINLSWLGVNFESRNDLLIVVPSQSSCF